jgi:hypothetical protein
LRFTFLPTNKVEIFEQVSKALPPFLFLSLSLSLLKLSSKKKTKTLQHSVGKGCSALLAIVASCNAAGHCRSNELQPAAGLATAASCNPLPASP